MGWLDRLVAESLRGGIPLAICLIAIVAGAIALEFTPREEEPQIVVPVVDVLVKAPGIGARQVERQVTQPLEKLLAQIPGVEHVYSTSTMSSALVTLRFYVGQDREVALLNTYNKLYSNQHRVPAIVSNWQVHPVEVDDIPIVLLALWSSAPEQVDRLALRRIADEATIDLQAISNTSVVDVTGGMQRTIRIIPDPGSLAARRSTLGDILNALRISSVLRDAGMWIQDDQSIRLQAGDFFRTIAALRSAVINVVDGNEVLLGDVAEITDGEDEPNNYTWIRFPGENADYPMVTLSIAKKRGSNAVRVADDVHAVMERLQKSWLPSGVHVEVIRDYGQTADAKVTDLTLSLAFAVFTVVVFIGVFINWRAALVVAFAVPVSYGITLALDMVFGYTINRVTLFALILALGLLVDDPITGVDNIERFLRRAATPVDLRIVGAIGEIRAPLIMSALTIVLAFLPLAWITGMMGPYMAPMAFNVPVSIAMSAVVAFLVTPWLSKRLLAPAAEEGEEAWPRLHAFYCRWMDPLLDDRRNARRALYVIGVLFLLAVSLPMFRLVPLKLLPFDNKNELQVVIDMPESATLEDTAAFARRIAQRVARLNEVQAVAAFVGVPSPVDFNGMVRHYDQRIGPHLADLRVTLLDKSQRADQSHAIVLRLRKALAPLVPADVTLRVVEVPPGPPVLSTVVAEVYGSRLTEYDALRDAAETVRQRLAREPLVTETDTTVGTPRRLLRFVADKHKAALSGVATEDISNALSIANAGAIAGYLPFSDEADPLPVLVRLPTAMRASVHDLEKIHVRGRPGIVRTSEKGALDAAPQPLVALGELGRFEASSEDRVILHKDLRPVVYVTAELNGRTPAEVIADISGDFGKSPGQLSDWHRRTYLFPGGGDGWELPNGIEVVWRGEGEWKITVDVFRDMGLAFAFALAAIFMVLRVQARSTALALIIMTAIPLTMIGIMPGFWLLNQFGEREVAGAPDPVLFTATAMIGMIALAGIVVRNSLILVEFIAQARAAGHTLKDALTRAVAIRMRPILLTAGTTLLGNVVIILDPVFSGLAWAIIFGILASTLFTLVVVPLVYLLVYGPAENLET